MHSMNQKYIGIIFITSVMLSVWLYLSSDMRLEKILTSQEWESSIIYYISPERSLGNRNRSIDYIDNVGRIDKNSNVKYLTNGTYLAVSRVTMYPRNNSSISVMTISEMGKWELSDSYLLVNPLDFKETSMNKDVDFDDIQLDTIKSLYILDAEQSRKIDVLNKNTLLSTDLNKGVSIFSSH